MRKDRKEILAKVNIVQVVGQFVQLTKKGAEYVGICPFHDDHHASLKVNEKKQIFTCFSCGAHGDAIAFMCQTPASIKGLGLEYLQACDYLEGKDGNYATQAQAVPKVAKTEKEQPQWITEWAPEGLRPANFHHFKYGQPTATYEWNAPDGRPIGWTARYEYKDPETGKIKKEVWPFNWGTNVESGEQKWVFRALPVPRPLYNLHRLADQKTVLIVEGEKTANAARELFPTLYVTTWPTGSNSTHNVDWSPIYGRNVLIWPDADNPGTKAAGAIANQLKEHCPYIRIVRSPKGCEKGWDVADADWDQDQAMAYLKANLATVEEFFAPPAPEQPAPVQAQHEEEQAPEPEQPKPQHRETAHSESSAENQYFKVLGFDKGDDHSMSYYFFSKENNQLVRISNSKITNMAALLQIAPLQFWQRQYPGKSEKAGFVGLIHAADDLINQANKAGPYYTDKMRGRGCWMESYGGAEWLVLHNGESLYARKRGSKEARKFDFASHKFKHIYQSARGMGLDIEAPALSASEAKRIFEVFDCYRWDRKISRLLYLGWLATAPFCGSFDWRSHLWVTGPSGNGKSTLCNDIGKMILGDACRYMQSNATEASIRNLNPLDATPVLVDEFDTELEDGIKRITAIKEYARACSSPDSPPIRKMMGGVLKEYYPRSSFLIISVNVYLNNSADNSRFSTINVSKGTDADYLRLLTLKDELLTPEWCRGFLSRSWQNLDVMHTAKKYIKGIVAGIVGSQRAGDQIGTLLAGAYAVLNDKQPTFEDCKRFVEPFRKELSLEADQGNKADHDRVLDKIMSKFTTLTTLAGTRYEKTVGHFVKLAASRFDPSEAVTAKIANDHLKSLGLKVKGDYLLVSNTSPWVAQVLAGDKTGAGINNWGTMLQRIEGAKTSDIVEAFGPGLKKARATMIPLAAIVGEEEEA